MILLAAGLAAIALWFLMSKKRRRVPAAWLGIAGTMIGAVLAAKGMPVAGALIATGSGLWLRYGDMLTGRRDSQSPASTSPARARPGQMSREEAAELLDISPDADAATIRAAHHRLIARNHPDAGGSSGLAARINAARDRLLADRNA